jgi:hypothetical protein
MKKAFIAILSLILTTNIFSQKIEIGFIGGYHHTFPHAFTSGDIDVVRFNPRSGAGFVAGGYFGWNFYKDFGMDFQLLYTMRSYSFNMSYNNDTTRKYSTIFNRQVFGIELPIHINYKFKVNDDLSVYPVLGATVSMGIHGKDLAYEDSEYRKPINKETDSGELFGKSGRMYRFEVSPEIGLLFKYKNWGIRPMYSVGLLNRTRKEFDWTYPLPSGQTKFLFNQRATLSVIYTFKL